MVSNRREEDLGFVFEPAEGFAVDDAVAVQREGRASWRGILGAIAMGVRRFRRVLSEIGFFELLGVLPDAKRGHGARARKLRVAACLGGHFA